MSESTKSAFASTLNALTEMQQSPAYAVRKSVLAYAEQIIVALEKDRASLNSMATLLANARRDRDELIEGLRLIAGVNLTEIVHYYNGHGDSAPSAIFRAQEQARALLDKLAPKDVVQRVDRVCPACGAKHQGPFQACSTCKTELDAGR